MKPIISVEHSSISYPYGFFRKPRVVLSNLSFSLLSGETMAIVGNNGSGKTTLLKALCNLIPFSSGIIQIHTHRIAYVPEHGVLPPFLTAYQFLAYNGQLAGMEKASLHEKIIEILNLVSLNKHAKARMSSFSKGMKQRLSIAQALLVKPELLLLDEPFSGLDSASIKVIEQLCFNDKKMSVIYSTHELPKNQSTSSILLLPDMQS